MNFHSDRCFLVMCLFYVRMSLFYFNFPSLFLKSVHEEIRSGSILPQVIVEMETSTRCLIIDIFRGIGFLLLWVL